MRRHSFSPVVLGTLRTETLCALSFSGNVSEHLNSGNKRTLKVQYRKICIFEINPLKPELNPICYLLVLLAHHFLHVTRIRVKSLTLR